MDGQNVESASQPTIETPRAQVDAILANTNMNQGEISYSSYNGKDEVKANKDAIEEGIRKELEPYLLEAASVPSEDPAEFKRQADIYTKQILSGVMQYRGIKWPDKVIKRYLVARPNQNKAFLSRMLAGMYVASINTDVPNRAINAVIATAELNGTDKVEALTARLEDFVTARARLMNEGRGTTASSIDKTLAESGFQFNGTTYVKQNSG